MTLFFRTVAATAVALAMIGPAHAQLLRGGLGGGFGGGLGVGGGLPTGSLSGDIGVAGAVDGTVPREHIRAPRTPKAPAVQATRVVTVPAAQLHAVVAETPRVVALPGRVVEATVRAVPVPAIADVAVRHEAIVAAGIAPIAYDDVPGYVDQQYVVLQDDLRGTGVVVEKRGEQIVLDMPSDVTFAFNKSDIQPRFYGILDAVSRTLAKYSASYVDVDGHTDAIGSYAYNQSLSERRADTVAQFLGARAVNPARMHVQGFGKTEPVASNATIQGRAANRRVEIILTPYAA